MRANSFSYIHICTNTKIQKPFVSFLPLLLWLSMGFCFAFHNSMVPDGSTNNPTRLCLFSCSFLSGTTLLPFSFAILFLLRLTRPKPIGRIGPTPKFEAWKKVVGMYAWHDNNKWTELIIDKKRFFGMILRQHYSPSFPPILPSSFSFSWVLTSLSFVDRRGVTWKGKKQPKKGMSAWGVSPLSFLFLPQVRRSAQAQRRVPWKGGVKRRSIWGRWEEFVCICATSHLSRPLPHLILAQYFQLLKPYVFPRPQFLSSHIHHRYSTKGGRPSFPPSSFHCHVFSPLAFKMGYPEGFVYGLWPKRCGFFFVFDCFWECGKRHAIDGDIGGCCRNQHEQLDEDVREH